MTPFCFYGTLMHRGGSRGGALLDSDLGTYGPDCEVRGILFDTGAFPAFVEGEGVEGEGVVKGQLWTPHPEYEAEATRILDQIESYFPDDPTHSMYLRRRVPVLKPQGFPEVFIYVWNYSLNGLEPIPSGAWVDRLAALS